MSRLGELGLSSYEEQVYRSLLSLGAAPAREVAAAADVPRGRIYDVLNGLVARELVRERATDPTRYEAAAPEAAVDRLLAERRRELDEQAARYEDLAEELRGDIAATTPTESRFWTAELGSDAAVELIRQVFDAADGSLRSAMSRPYEAAPFERYQPEVGPLLECLDDDLDVRALVTAEMLEGMPDAVVASYTDQPANVETRVTTDLGITFDLLDGREVFFHVVHPLEEGERLGAIHVRDGSLADRLGSLFERCWADAVPVEDVVRSGGTLVDE